MPRYYFDGEIKLTGVQFIVDADTRAEAIARAKSNDWDDYDVSGASSTDSDITPDVIESEEDV